MIDIEPIIVINIGGGYELYTYFMAVLSVSNSDFKSKVANGWVLIDFWAEWCGPCRQLAPVIDEVAVDMIGKVNVYKLNVDECPEIAAEFAIRSIPTLILFKDGAKKSVKVGGASKAELVLWVESNF